jgi:peptide alpha-N-acetyltransferase
LLSLSSGVYQRQHLISLALSSHYLGELDEAVKFLNLFLESFPKGSPCLDSDYSEGVFYKVHLLEQSGKFEDALETLKMCSLMSGFSSFKVQNARLLQKLDRHDEALPLYLELLHSNPDSEEYIEGYINSSTATRGESLDALKVMFPTSERIQIHVLKSAGAEEKLFSCALRDFIAACVLRGAISSFSNLLTSCSDPSKTMQMWECLCELKSECSGLNSFNKSMLLHMMAQCQLKQGKFRESIDIINEAILAFEGRDCPVALYLLKAKIHKFCGDFSGARRSIDLARRLEPKDRSLNAKYAKYLLRNDEFQAALDILSLFSRVEVGDTVTDLQEMQCLWFELESGELHFRKSDCWAALKYFHQVLTQFDDFYDDQFDFHTYCLRKMNLKSYYDMLKFQDQIKNSPLYSRAISGCVKSYLLLSKAHPEVMHNACDSSSLPTRTKLKAKAKNLRKNCNDGSEAAFLKKDPLEEASILLDLLSSVSSSLLEFYLLSIDVHLANKKWILALQIIKKSVGQFGPVPELLPGIAQLISSLLCDPSPIPEPLFSLIIKELEQIGFSSIQFFRHLEENVLNKSNCLLSICSTAKCYALLGNKAQGERVVQAWLNLKSDDKWGAKSFREYADIAQCLSEELPSSLNDIIDSLKHHFSLD